MCLPLQLQQFRTLAVKPHGGRRSFCPDLKRTNPPSTIRRLGRSLWCLQVRHGQTGIIRGKKRTDRQMTASIQMQRDAEIVK
ncbi:uncharacterized protein V6R79_007354 [Siganus canaliculatus]